MSTSLKKLQDQITELKADSEKTGVDHTRKISKIKAQIKEKKSYTGKKEYDKEYMRKYYLEKIKPARQSKPKVEHTLTCVECGKEFKANKLGIKYCPECKVKVLKEQRKKYNEAHKEEYQKRQKAYRKTEAYKKAQKKYRESEKGKQHLKEYYQRPEVKERMREYQKSEKAKAYKRQYQANKNMSIKQARAIIEKAKELGLGIE